MKKTMGEREFTIMYPDYNEFNTVMI